MGSKKQCLKKEFFEIDWKMRQMKTLHCGDKDSNGFILSCKNCEYNKEKEKKKKWKRPTQW